MKYSLHFFARMGQLEIGFIKENLMLIKSASILNPLLIFASSSEGCMHCAL